MTQEELNYIKDSFSQILDDIGGNPDWHEAARAVAFDLGTLERELEKKVVKFPSNLDKAANEEADDLLAHMKIDGDMIYLPTAKALMIALSRFGAEWMAGQGWTVKKKIGKIDDGVNQIPTYCNGFEITELDVPFLNSKECGYGNEVIVQIRKKQ